MYYLDAKGGPIVTLLPEAFTNSAGTDVSVDGFNLSSAAARIALGIWPLISDPAPDPTQAIVVGETYEKGPTTGTAQPNVMLRHWQTRPLTPAEQQALATSANALAVATISAEIDNKVQSMFAGGLVPVGDAYSGKTAQLDQVSQNRITAAGADAKLALLAAAMGDPPNPAFSIGWIMADNTTLTLDAAGMSGLADQSMAAVQKWVANGRTHKNAVISLAAQAGITPAQILAYDFSGGW